MSLTSTSTGFSGNLARDVYDTVTHSENHEVFL